MNNEIALPIETAQESAPSLPEVKRQPRVTVVCTVYHSIPNEQVKGPEPIRSSRFLDSEDQAYSRSIKLNGDWQPLDFGWLEGTTIALALFENATKMLLGRSPTIKQVEEHEAKVIEYGLLIEGRVHPIGYLPPDEGSYILPSNLMNMVFRSRSGEAKLSYFLVPA